MSFLKCNECRNLFNAKEELGWEEYKGHITCVACVEEDHEHFGEPELGSHDLSDDQQALDSVFGEDDHGVERM